MYTAFFGRKMSSLLAIGTLCLSTHKHNGKSGTERTFVNYCLVRLLMIYFRYYRYDWKAKYFFSFNLGACIYM